MIKILHGDDIVRSRQELETIKKQNKEAEVLFFDGRKVDLFQIRQALEASSIFSTVRLVIIENLLSTKKSQKQQEIVSYLGQNPTCVDLIRRKALLILWEREELSKSLLAKLPKAEITFFKPEPILFKFLESIRPNNEREMLTLLARCIRVRPPEIVFYMIVRQFRFLLLVKDGTTSGVEELDRLADWQKERLARQTKCFTEEQLIDIYHQLLEIDYQQKTGQSAFDLAKTLELFLTNL